MAPSRSLVQINTGGCERVVSAWCGVGGRENRGGVEGRGVFVFCVQSGRRRRRGRREGAPQEGLSSLSCVGYVFEDSGSLAGIVEIVPEGGSGGVGVCDVGLEVCCMGERGESGGEAQGEGGVVHLYVMYENNEKKGIFKSKGIGIGKKDGGRKKAKPEAGKNHLCVGGDCFNLAKEGSIPLRLMRIKGELCAVWRDEDNRITVQSLMGGCCSEEGPGKTIFSFESDKDVDFSLPMLITAKSSGEGGFDFVYCSSKSKVCLMPNCCRDQKKVFYNTCHDIKCIAVDSACTNHDVLVANGFGVIFQRNKEYFLKHSLDRDVSFHDGILYGISRTNDCLERSVLATKRVLGKIENVLSYAHCGDSRLAVLTFAGRIRFFPKACELSSGNTNNSSMREIKMIAGKEEVLETEIKCLEEKTKLVNSFIHLVLSQDKLIDISFAVLDDDYIECNLKSKGPLALDQFAFAYNTWEGKVPRLQQSDEFHSFFSPFKEVSCRKATCKIPRQNRPYISIAVIVLLPNLSTQPLFHVLTETVMPKPSEQHFEQKVMKMNSTAVNRTLASLKDRVSHLQCQAPFAPSQVHRVAKEISLLVSDTHQLVHEQVTLVLWNK
eukprot:Nk52_evm1s1307 gene=Nk52_evmTU1s1307